MKRTISILLFIFTVVFYQSAISHDHGKLKGKVVDYTVDGEQYEGYFISPKRTLHLF